MRIKNIGKRAVVLGLAGLMLTSGAVSAAPVYNAEADTSATEHPHHEYEFEHEATQYVIDTNHRGILHIHKSEINSDSDVLSQLGDVTYTIYRVADIEQGHLDGTGTQVSVEYRSLIKDSTTAKNTIAIPSGLKSAEELDRWVSDLLDSDDAGKRMSNLEELPHWTETTDSSGNATFDGDGEGLPLGIYIVYEASHPSQVTEVQPFVVSIPTTSVDDGNNDTKWPGEADQIAGDNMQGSPENAGIYWIYDLQAHPKNKTNNLSVEKHIVADEGDETAYEVQDGVNDPSNDVLTDAEDFEIGDRIRYWMKADVPGSIGEIEIYYLLDRMSVGQTFINDVASGNRRAQMEVWGKTPAGDMIYIPRYTGTVENYRVVSADEMDNVTNHQDFSDFYGNSMTMRAADQPDAYAHENAFAVLFNTQSLSKDQSYDGTTKRIPLYSEVYVTYNLTLNEKALVGVPGNVNDVALVLSHRTTDNQFDITNEVHVPEQDVFEPFVDPEEPDLDVINPQCIDTRVYTYALQVTKIGEGTENMEGVTFELRDEEGNLIPISRYTEADSDSLAVDDCSGRIGDYYVDKDAADSAEITIDADQEVFIYGLESGTYQLLETKTIKGYQLLKEPIVLTVVSDSAVSAQPMYYSDEENDRYRWTDSETLTFDSDYGMETADSAASGIFDVSRGMYQDGLFAFTVLNRRGFNIPATGGVGTTLFIAMGTGVAGMGVSGVLLSRKRRQHEDIT